MHAPSSIDKLDLAKISSSLKTKGLGYPVGFKNELWDSIDSTNTRALALAKEGASHGVIVLAREQTAGRGRLGRNWVSPPDSGIYMSFLLRPANLKPQLTLVTIAAGLACAKAIERCLGVRIGIKWVNDLIYSGRKLGGILCEFQQAHTSTPLGKDALVIGIGINIDPQGREIPAELSSRMAWLCEATPEFIDRNLLVAEIAFELEQAIQDLATGETDIVLNGWRQYTVTLGESIIATVGNQQLMGLAIDLDCSGALILDTHEGRRLLHAGEVTIRKADGSYV
jgi:BirA family biotin operon repressor/biotin-[acetyl-CoA-carboxylase] ligase